MLLLHLSDIHFKVPDCLDEDTDPEKPYRTYLVKDLVQQCAKLGAVDAILVGGDIAFQADPKEYETAEKWLREVADECGCPKSRIYVIPGNHDIVRSITGKMSTRNAQRAIKNAPAAGKEKEFRRQIGDADTGTALFAPLGPYNDFARAYNCHVSPTRIYWRQDLELEQGVKLRICGLTSCLLSNVDGVKDEPLSQYLSPLQTALNPEKDVVILAMAHHPPSWCSDEGDIEDQTSDRAAIHLFGHVHKQRIRTDKKFVRFFAGAVNPERDEPGWMPGYNLIEVKVDGEGKSRTLHVNAYLRQFQLHPQQFIAVKFEDQDFLPTTIAIPAAPKLEFKAAAKATIVPAVANSPEPVESKPDPETAMSDDETRDLVFRFWKLRSSDQREVVENLQLLTEQEWALPENDRYFLALKRAAERGLIKELAREIQRVEAKYG